MALRASGNQTAASVSLVKLRAGVQAVTPRADISATVPAADVAYVLLSTNATLDVTGRFRYVPELVVVTEAVALAVAKAFSDSTTTTDSLVHEVTKSLADSVGFTEVFVATLVFLRDFTESVTATDTQTLAIDKPLSELITALDAASRQFSKYLADGVAMNDSFDLSDGLLYAFSKATTNAAFVTDARQLTTTKTISDMIAPADAGSLVSQGYCDITYFAEDYVGESRTFS